MDQLENWGEAFRLLAAPCVQLLTRVRSGSRIIIDEVRCSGSALPDPSAGLTMDVRTPPANAAGTVVHNDKDACLRLFRASTIRRTQQACSGLQIPFPSSFEGKSKLRITGLFCAIFSAQLNSSSLIRHSLHPSEASSPAPKIHVMVVYCP